VTQIPLFILDHTFFNDVYRDDYGAAGNYQTSSKQVNDYLILRQAISKTKDKVSVTSSEVFDRLSKKFQDDPKVFPQMIQAIQSFIEISSLTSHLREIDYKESIIILALEKSADKKICLISNTTKERKKEQIKRFMEKYLKRKIRDEDVSFEIMNTDEVIEFIKIYDKSIYDAIMR